MKHKVASVLEIIHLHCVHEVLSSIDKCNQIIPETSRNLTCANYPCQFLLIEVLKTIRGKWSEMLTQVKEFVKVNGHQSQLSRKQTNNKREKNQGVMTWIILVKRQKKQDAFKKCYSTVDSSQWTLDSLFDAITEIYDRFRFLWKYLLFS